ncbi:MAG: phenylalanine--tRNA ligase subunit beta [Nanoarchaeota archaeon]
MVMTTISLQALQQALGEQLSVEEISSALFDMGMELKGETEGMLSVEITPERLDLVSVHGLARAIAALLGKAGHPPRYLASKSDYTVKITREVDDVRPHTVCAVVKNLKLDANRIEEIIEAQEKLHATLGRNRQRGAIGIYPLDAMTMPITFTAGAPEEIVFRPLGAENEMSGSDILTDHETGQAYKHLLDGKTKYPYFIDANGEILSMPPIINSEKTGRVNEKTTDLFIECSGFEIDILEELLVNITTMFADMGGDVYHVNVVYPDGTVRETPGLSPHKRTLTSASIRKYLGLDLDEKQVRTLLLKMMYDVHDKTTTDKDGNMIWTVDVPPFRFDVWHEVDIIDDIGRAYGFNNFRMTVPEVSSIGGVLDSSRIREEIAEILVGLGFLETYTFAITTERDQHDTILIDSEDESYVPIANGNESQTMLRTRLLPELLKSLSHNRSRPLPQQIFEGAFVTIPDETADVASREELRLSAMRIDKTVTFTEIRQVLEQVLRTRAITPTFKAVDKPYFLEGRSAEVFIDDEYVGVVGELHPQVLANAGLSNPVGAFEISLEQLFD